MKPTNNFLINQQPKFKWKNFLKTAAASLSSLCLSVWEVLLSLVKMKMLHLRQTLAATGILDTLRAFLNQCLRQPFLQTKRHLVGWLLMGAGVFAYFTGLIFFDPLVYDHAPCQVFGQTHQCFSFETGAGWCFMSWFLYFQEVGIYYAVLFWSVAAFLLIPWKFSGVSSVVFSLANAFAWVKILHISLFARSYETFHAAPTWQVLVMGVAFGFGIILSAKNLVFWYNHRDRSNHARWVGVHKLDIDQAMKNKIFDELVDEYNSTKQMM